MTVNNITINGRKGGGKILHIGLILWAALKRNNLRKFKKG